MGLPFPTKVGDHAKRTECLACVRAYQTLPDRMLAMLKPLVILDWSTNCYQSAELSLNLPCIGFTNHYHRGEGQGIDLGMGGHAVGVATWALW